MTQVRFEELMVKVVDATASPAEREELMSWVAAHPELQLELEEHQALRAVTEGWMARLEADLMEDRQREGAFHRLAQGLGVLAVLAGAVVLTLFGAVELLGDPKVPAGIKWGLGLSYGGFGFLVLYLATVRIFNQRNDPYSKVIR